MKRWAVQLQVVCDSRETADAYATKLNELLKSRQLRLPEGYILAEIGVAQGDHFPDQKDPRPITDVSLVEGGLDD